jgi:hypothetical protein
VMTIEAYDRNVKGSGETVEKSKWIKKLNIAKSTNRDT